MQVTSTDENRIRVLLLDDHEIVRVGIRDLVQREEDIAVVAEAHDAASTFSALRSVAVDVALIDVRLGDEVSGLDVCRQVRDSYDSVACVILTSFDDDQARLEAREAGAVAFLTKQIRSNEIVETIRKVAAGSVLLDNAAVRMAQRRLDGDEATLLDQLTDRERQIFDLIGKGQTNKQIAASLGVAEKTVKNYITSMLLKLQIERRTEAAAMAARIEERQRRRFS